MDDVVELRMHHRLAAGNGNDGRSQRAKFVDAAFDELNRNRRRGVVILVTVATREIAPSHRNKVRKHRVTSRSERASDEAELPNLLLNEFRFTHYEDLEPAWKNTAH